LSFRSLIREKTSEGGERSFQGSMGEGSSERTLETLRLNCFSKKNVKKEKNSCQGVVKKRRIKNGKRSEFSGGKTREWPLNQSGESKTLSLGLGTDASPHGKISKTTCKTITITEQRFPPRIRTGRRGGKVSCISHERLER